MAYIMPDQFKVRVRKQKSMQILQQTKLKVGQACSVNACVRLCVSVCLFACVCVCVCGGGGGGKEVNRCFEQPRLRNI